MEQGEVSENLCQLQPWKRILAMLTDSLYICIFKTLQQLSFHDTNENSKVVL